MHYYLYRVIMSYVHLVRDRYIHGCLLLCMICLQQMAYAQPVTIENAQFRLPEYQKTFQEDTQTIEARVAELKQFQHQYPDSAILLYRELLKSSLQQNHVLTTVRVLLHFGDFYTGLGMYTEALQTLRYALTYCNQMASTHLTPYIYNHLAHVYQIRGDYEMAVLYLYQALLTNEPHPVISRSYIYNNLAIVLMDVGIDSSAWYYLDLGERYANEQENHEILGGILLHKGIILEQQGRQEDAMLYYARVLELTYKHDLPALRFSVLASMGRIRILQGQYAAAFALIRSAQTLEKKVAPVNYNNSIVLMGSAYLLMGRYEQAEHFLHVALKNAEENHIASDLTSVYHNLSDLYARIGRYKEAYQFQQQYARLKDSLRTREILDNINKTEIRYRTAQKDKEIAYKELLLVRQQNNIRIVWAVSLSLILVLVVFYVYKQRLQQTKIAALKQEEKVKSLHAFIKGEEAERSKMANELHDGVGGLLSTAIMYLDELPSKYTVLKPAADYKEVVDTVTEALEEIRKTAHSLMPELVIRYGLPHSIRLFCNKIERGGRIRVDFQCYGFNERLSPDFELSIYRIVQELMQNVIRHANATKVLVQISAHHGILSITVEDNGVGISDYFREGMGLETIRARVVEMNGVFSISRIQPNGTNAYLEFDLQLQKKQVT